MVRPERGAGRALAAERLALVGLDQALEDFAGPADGRLLGVKVGDRRTAARRRSRRSAGDSRQPLPGIIPMPRQAGRSPRRHRASIRLGGQVALGRDGPRVGVLELVPARTRAGTTRAADALEDVERLEAGDHDRHPVAARPAAGTRQVPITAADVAGGEERLHPAGRRLHDRRDGRRHQHVATPAARSSRCPGALAWYTAMALAGAVVSKPIPKNTTCRSGFSAGQLQRVERRVDDPDVAAARS